MSACIEVKNLKKYFDTPAGKLHAVDDISLKIEKGTTMGVVGESGCGKSTLGRTIVHLQDSTDGQIFLNGEDITHVQGKQLRVLHEKMQIIFQDPYSSLNPRMTIGETIREPLLLSKRYSKPELDREVTKLMDKAGIEARLRNAYPHELMAEDGSVWELHGHWRSIRSLSYVMNLSQPWMYPFRLRY